MISLYPRYINIALIGLSGLKYGVLLVLLILPSTFNFNPPENKDKTFSGGVNDCVETANSFNLKLLHFFY
jgi:hypothetical protein